MLTWSSWFIDLQNEILVTQIPWQVPELRPTQCTWMQFFLRADKFSYHTHVRCITILLQMKPVWCKRGLAVLTLKSLTSVWKNNMTQCWNNQWIHMGVLSFCSNWEYVKSSIWLRHSQQNWACTGLACLEPDKPSCYPQCQPLQIIIVSILDRRKRSWKMWL